jgi:iron complex transport system ATP-binding protein
MQVNAQQIVVELSGQRIVREVSLNVATGEIVGLVGPNGSGKSTFLRTIYRVLRPLAGRILLDTREVWKMSARETARSTGVVVQEALSEFEFTAREMVQMGRNPHRGLLDRDTAEDTLIVNEALQRVHMLAYGERAFTTLSGGEKQRVLVARALAQQPQLLVLDEPTNHLDIQHQFALLELVCSLKMTTLVTLHDLNLAAAYCQRLYVLSEGQIVAE